MKVFFFNTGQSFNTAQIFEKEDITNIEPVNFGFLEQPISQKQNNEFDGLEQLQEQVLNSLNYASSQKALPSTLPEQLNVKFLNISTLDKIIDRIMPSPIAQLEDPNTMYISTNLLPQNQLNSKNNLISKLYNKFKNPQQVLDPRYVDSIYHEVGHWYHTFFNPELKNEKECEIFADNFKEKYL